MSSPAYAFTAQATVQELSKVTSETRGTSLVTLYVPGETKLSQVTSQISNELATSQNIKSKAVRSAVGSALRSGLQRVKSISGHVAPEQGFVLLAGEANCRV